MRLTLIHPAIGRQPGVSYMRTWQMEPLPIALRIVPGVATVPRFGTYSSCGMPAGALNAIRALLFVSSRKSWPFDLISCS